MNDEKQKLLDLFNFRHATKEYDVNKKVSETDLNFILEAGKLAPSSYGLEPYKVLIISNNSLKTKLSPVMFGQKQVETSSYLIYFLTMKLNDLKPDSKYVNHILTDVKKMPQEMLNGYVDFYKTFQGLNAIDTDRTANDWATKQAYISLAYMTVAAAKIGVDSCPMEGFDPALVNKILAENNIDTDKYHASVALTLGYKAAEPMFPKTRKSNDETYIWLK